MNPISSTSLRISESPPEKTVRLKVTASKVGLEGETGPRLVFIHSDGTKMSLEHFIEGSNLSDEERAEYKSLAAELTDNEEKCHLNLNDLIFKAHGKRETYLNSDDDKVQRLRGLIQKAIGQETSFSWKTYPSGFRSFTGGSNPFHAHNSDQLKGLKFTDKHLTKALEKSPKKKKEIHLGSIVAEELLRTDWLKNVPCKLDNDTTLDAQRRATIVQKSREKWDSCHKEIVKYVAAHPILPDEMANLETTLKKEDEAAGEWIQDNDLPRHEKIGHILGYFGFRGNESRYKTELEGARKGIALAHLETRNLYSVGRGVLKAEETTDGIEIFYTRLIDQIISPDTAAEDKIRDLVNGNSLRLAFEGLDQDDKAIVQKQIIDKALALREICKTVSGQITDPNLTHAEVIALFEKAKPTP